MNQLQDTIDTYDDIAPQYADAAEPKINEQQFIKLLSQFEDYLTGNYILDLGCGSGRDTVYFYQNGYEVIGIDLSKGQIKQANKLHPECTFKVMDMRKLDFKAESFHGIWAMASLVHLSDQEVNQTLTECKRVLKHNGILYLSVKQGHGEGEESSSRYKGKTRYYNYFQPKDLSHKVSQAGFEVLNCEVKPSTSRKNLNWIHLFAKKPEYTSAT